MRIAVDVMGGDHGVDVVIEGTRLALEANPQISRLFLVGQEGEIKAAMSRKGCTDQRIEVVHASEVLTMEDKPTDVLRRKRDCSMVRTIDLVKQGQADGMISRGNTGGLFAASTVMLRPVDGLKRAAIATVIPKPRKEFVLLDAGANAECKPLHLVHFAVMGAVYAREILGHANPRVGILSIGREESKGNELTREAAKLCKLTHINFIGNIEGHDLFEDVAEVVVADGFVGNIVLKTLEGFAHSLAGWVMAEVTRNLKRKLGALLLKNALRPIKRRMDPEAYGGAPLLGLTGNVLKAHGSARERSVQSAVHIATEFVSHNINQLIRAEIARANDALPRDILNEPAPARS